VARLFLFLISVFLQNVWELMGWREGGATADLFKDRCVRLLVGGLGVSF